MLRIYISADIEGVSGVVNSDHASPTGRDYERARRLMTGEVRAAVTACLDAGAEVVVNDAHGGGTNILIEDLPAGCRLVTGWSRPLGMMEGLEPGFDGALFIGYHARAGTPGVLNHTISGGTVRDVRMNGGAWGEIGINAALAGHMGVPLLVVSGDDGVAGEVSGLGIGAEVVVVKVAKGRYAADCLPAVRVHELIGEATAAAIRNVKGGSVPAQLRLEGPVRVELDLTDTARADMAGVIPGVERVSPVTCAYDASDYLEAYRILRVMITMGQTASR